MGNQFNSVRFRNNETKLIFDSIDTFQHPAGMLVDSNESIDDDACMWRRRRKIAIAKKRRDLLACV